MFLKSGPDQKRPRGWSLSLTLMAYYSFSAFLIVLTATGFLYFAMVRNLDLEDDRLLADRIRLLHSLLLQQPLNLDLVRKEVDESWQSGQRTQVFIRILDGQSQVICESKQMSEVLPQSLFSNSTQHPGMGADTTSATGRLVRIMAERLTQSPPQAVDWTIHVAMDRGEEQEILDGYRENLILVLGASFIICAAFGYYITERGIRPLTRITDAVRLTQPSNLSERLDRSGLPRELESLVDTFNSLMERLDQSFQRLSGFTADIAHELRTPVNNMRGELDVALTRPRTPEEYEEIVGSSLEELGRLSRTIDSLLFLARSENPQTQIQRDEIELLDELQRLRDFYSATAEDVELTLKVEAQPGIVARLNRALIQQAVGNLVTNSISHTPPGGTVTIRASRNPTDIVIEVIDTGRGIDTEHQPHVFQRFYRADHMSSNHRAGLGLGLSIVNSIVELHGGRVELQSEVGVGTSVKLLFPQQK